MSYDKTLIKIGAKAKSMKFASKRKSKFNKQQENRIKQFANKTKKKKVKNGRKTITRFEVKKIGRVYVIPSPEPETPPPGRNLEKKKGKSVVFS